MHSWLAVTPEGLLSLWIYTIYMWPEEGDGAQKHVGSIKFIKGIVSLSQTSLPSWQLDQ